MNELVEKKITCPHCWHEFFGDTALYISQHDELFGDPVLGDVHSRFTPFEVKRNRDGRVVDPKGWEMVERACPRCHLQIPEELLRERPKFISIVGAPRSGKTYFLNVMLHNLKKCLARQFSYTFDICDSHDKELFVKNEQTLFFSQDPSVPVLLTKTEEAGGHLYNEILLDGVRVQLPKPFTFTMRSTTASTHVSSKPKQMSVILYDNAGESFFFGRANDGTNRSTQHLGESDAVLFAYDPLLDPDARMRLASISSDPQLLSDKSVSRQQEILTAVIHRIRKHSRTPDYKKLKASLAVCVQKYDVWKPLLDHCRTEDGNRVIDHTSIEYFKQHGIAALDVQEINIVSHLVKSFIQDICPEFVAAAEGNFERVRYFPVSALGRSPVVDGDLLKIAPINIQPFRVEHPMLWLLRDWRLISRTTNSRPNSRNYPVASIGNVTTDRLHVKCPETGELFVLDHEYAGSNFFNPETRQYFWIPAISRPVPNKPVPPVKASQKSSNNGEELKLKLSTSKKKSGWSSWFGRKG